MILYGLSSCDTCRKARKALEAAGRDVTFRDVRESPLSPEERVDLLAEFGEALINRRSTTWRQLPEDARNASPDDLLAAHPTLMKRPVLVEGLRRTLGWDAAVQGEWIG
ncbi:arsenate reductase family protein [Tropicimonas sp. IMCC6043]|uniref:arsenate reductase family protein n=1 Tax=Tropicimonas sp. IMCC6043 TaxID=2510645 RepID=UPI00101D7BF8|nr:ArsC/Spx/MgsR family protein [Tropicimonas sp. IMCC6043]RYH11201.1 arsenate reductase [Tropicimonas sp. IMCC6043]